MRLRPVTWFAMLLVQAGCLRPAPPKLNLEQPAPPEAALDLKPYFQAARFGEWTYERTELENENARPVRYVRQVTADRWSEGNLAGHPLLALDRYIEEEPADKDDHSGAGEKVRELLPLSGHDSSHIFRLDEPMAPIPPALADTSPVVNTSGLSFYNRRGHREATGTITRRAEIEGFQAVDCPAGHFNDCLRVRIELEMRFSGGLEVDWKSYVWLSRDAGEVRRIDEFSGEYWVFGFGSAYEFLLVSLDRNAVQSQPVPLAPNWAFGLIALNRGIPRPRISGAVFDFAVPAVP